MARILISGYFGFGNTGDEAVLAAMASHLRSLAPDVEIAALSADPAHTARVHGVRAVPRMRPSAVFAAMRNCDVFVSGGGSLLQDATGPKSVPYYLGLVALARMLGKPTVMYAQGVGPVRGRLGRALIRAVVPGMTVLTVRDPGSRRLLFELGVPEERITVCADPVFGLEPDWGGSWAGAAAGEGGAGGEKVPDGSVADVTMDPAGASEARRRARAAFGLDPDEPLIGVALRALPRSSDLRGLVQGFASVLDRLCGELGAGIVLMPFQPSQDAALAEAVAKRSKARHRIISPPEDPRKAMALVAGMDMLIAMRLHALIFAAACGVPFVPASYDPKVSALAAEFGLRAPDLSGYEPGSDAAPPSCCGDPEPRGDVFETIADEAVRLWGMRSEERQRILAVAAKARQQALVPARMTIDLINAGR